MQTVLAQLAPALATALFTFVVALVGLAADALRKKLKSESALNVLSRLEHLATDVVLEAQQTTVDDLKAVSKDGLLKVSDAQQIASDVLSKLKLHLGEQGIKEATKALGLPGEAHLDSILKAKIEASVASLPKTKTPG